MWDWVRNRENQIITVFSQIEINIANPIKKSDKFTNLIKTENRVKTERTPQNTKWQIIFNVLSSSQSYNLF